MTHPAPSLADMTADRIAAGRHSITKDTQPWHLAAHLIFVHGVVPRVWAILAAVIEQARGAK